MDELVREVSIELIGIKHLYATGPHNATDIVHEMEELLDKDELNLPQENIDALKTIENFSGEKYPKTAKLAIMLGFIEHKAEEGNPRWIRTLMDKGWGTVINNPMYTAPDVKPDLKESSSKKEFTGKKYSIAKRGFPDAQHLYIGETSEGYSFMNENGHYVTYKSPATGREHETLLDLYVHLYDGQKSYTNMEAAQKAHDRIIGVLTSSDKNECTSSQTTGFMSTCRSRCLDTMGLLFENITGMPPNSQAVKRVKDIFNITGKGLTKRRKKRKKTKYKRRGRRRRRCTRRRGRCIRPRRVR